MGEQDWGRWQVILGVIGIIITVGGLIYSGPSDPIDPDPEPELTPTPTPTPTTGNISVASSPSGASIYLDSVYQGTTPMILNNIEQGSHTISLKLEGYEEYSQIANVDVNKQTSILAILPSNEKPSSLGSISVNSDPVGASISLDGIYKGETPKTLENIEQGSHVITLELAEYDSWTQTVSVDPGETLSLSPILTTKDVSEETTASEEAYTLTPTAEIENVWFEPNILVYGLNGMMTHVKFNTYNLEGKQCEVAEHFCFTNGEILEDFNNQYTNSDGEVTSTGYYTPLYESDTCNDFLLYIPYNELHLSSGTINYLEFYVEIYHEGEVLDTSDWIPITVTQN